MWTFYKEWIKIPLSKMNETTLRRPRGRILQFFTSHFPMIYWVHSSPVWKTLNVDAPQTNALHWTHQKNSVNKNNDQIMLDCWCCSNIRQIRKLGTRRILAESTIVYGVSGHMTRWDNWPLFINQTSLFTSIHSCSQINKRHLIKNVRKTIHNVMVKTGLTMWYNND